jgi:alpha-tubulin suppressor-like RCC1 family protein
MRRAVLSLLLVAACSRPNNNMQLDAELFGIPDSPPVDAELFPFDTNDAGPPPLNLHWRVVVGGTGACALRDDGGVKCWGGIQSNEMLGFAGDAPGEMGSALPLVDLGSGRTAKDLTVGSEHACALLDNARVKCWGQSELGQLGLGDATQRGAAANTMGDALPFVDLGTGRTVLAISAGDEQTCAILDTHGVKCWGENAAGALGLGDTKNRGSGAGEMGDALPFVDLGTGRTATAIFAGYQRSCALLDDETLKCWGNNEDGAMGQGQLVTHVGVMAGQMGDALAPINLGTGLHAASAIHGGASIYARFADGTVKGWGRNLEGELAIGDGSDRGDQPGEMGDALPVADLGAPVVSIVGAAGHACALYATGVVACWGSNYEGSLGLGLADNASVGTMSTQLGAHLVKVSLAGPVAALSASGIDTCAMLVDGHIQCWGANSLGQLGIGDTRNRGDAAADMGSNLPFVDLGP